ncbi:hypothetical protein QNO00_11200 [Arthrobacter sp. zg-Y1219]|uniref:P-loop ATPase, Sll1717 family n=1 Tax=Arthrobacter sp. zg-Y1219 TaxID=3049067 RepID=UPI0024C36232|nr:hypothetical protein [Arthrobacter sp. zg-Y1219]MDK1360829.1 hypothetical protein [Arthrobacter sp. zg-Y1219]
MESIDVGSDVAESDLGLQQHFIATSAFDQVVRDETDLVLGPKGAGKTAIFRMLANDQYPIPQLADTDIIAAFNTEGDVLFQNLRLYVDDFDESSLRLLWTSYILSLTGWHLVTTYDAIPEAQQLRASLLANGLQEVSAKPRSAWGWVTEFFKRVGHAKTIEGRLDLGTGLPGMSGKAEFVDQSKMPNAGSIDTDGLMAQIIALLDKVDRRCWLIFDRLDEAFEDDSELERIALRSLMRAHSNLASYSRRFRTKLFLRIDILDRITTEKGFVNITHLRSMEISWTRQHILDMLIKRMTTHDDVMKLLFARNVQTPKGALNVLLSGVDESPKRAAAGRGGKQITDPLTYILDKTTDASQEYNPRNVVFMIDRAKSLEASACKRSDSDILQSDRSAISQESLIRAWRLLSEKRLVDTLYAEHNSLRQAIEAFQNGPQSFSREYVADRLKGLEGEPRNVNAWIRELQYAGFLKQVGVGTYRIPDIWRPALKLVPLPPGHKPRHSNPRPR